MRRRSLTVIAITTVLVGGSATTALGHARPIRPDHADWEKITAAAGLRRLALAPHRTARFRAFTADLGLHQLTSIRPLGPGRCATAVVYLYNNLLDLDNAQPGENWQPLRRLVAKEPSIRACAPRHANVRRLPSTGAALHIHGPPADPGARARRRGRARGSERG